MPRTLSVPEAAGKRRPVSWPCAPTLLFPAGCLCFAILLGWREVLYTPDSGWYRLLALGQRASVPAPFSARILGPAIAGWLGRLTGLGMDRGFLLLGIASLLALLSLVAGILSSWRAPAAIFAAVFLMPFWVDIFHDYYLPDLLHAVLLAAILVCLYFGQTTLALVLLFPAYLARESTILVAICLIFAGWRRIPLRSALVGVVAVAGAGFVSRHFAQGGPAGVHGLGGGTYILGKLVWSFFKNFLGLPLWSNTLPECRPIWVKAVPRGVPLGAIQTIGVCRPDLWGPSRLLLAWFGVFGIGPAFALALRGKIFSPDALSGQLWRRPARIPAGETAGAKSLSRGQIVVLRFCIVYGAISILMTPVLGASADRLVEYGWPFYFVALPWFIVPAYRLRGLRTLAFLMVHLLAGWLAWYGFKQYSNVFVFPAIAVVGLNAIAYVLLRSFPPPD